MRAMAEPTRAQPFVPEAGHGRGVLILAPGGRSDTLVRDAAVRLARHGFVAFGAELPAAGDGAPSDAERRAVDAGIERLFNEQATDGARVGVMGFGRGGLLAHDAAERGARVAVVVAMDADLDPCALDPGQPDRYDATAARASWDAALARLRAEL
jgi:dienelactone hydrolase